MLLTYVPPFYCLPLYYHVNSVRKEKGFVLVRALWKTRLVSRGTDGLGLNPVFAICLSLPYINSSISVGPRFLSSPRWNEDALPPRVVKMRRYKECRV